MVATASDSNGPLFPPHSPLRRVASESIMIFGGQRALLMQIALPGIAAGVLNHSDVFTQPVARLLSTLDTLAVMVWGTRAEAAGAVRGVHATHDGINGLRSDGAPYTAHDSEMQLWVWATLVDTSDLLFERYVRPYRPAERDRVYLDWVRFGHFFGLPSRVLPATRAELGHYVASMPTSGKLQVDETTQAVARAVLRPGIPLVPGVTWDAATALTASLLPVPLRDAYGLPWGPCEKRMARSVDRTIRTVWPLVPRARRRLPDVYMRLRRSFGPLSA